MGELCWDVKCDRDPGDWADSLRAWPLGARRFQEPTLSDGEMSESLWRVVGRDQRTRGATRVGMHLKYGKPPAPPEE